MAKKAKTALAKSAETAPEQPYYLQRAHIKDFRSIRNAVVEFEPGLNIIIGPNGSGKTNFVRCIQNGLDKLQPDFSAEVYLALSGRNSIEIEVLEKVILTPEQLQAQELTLETKQSVIKSRIGSKSYEGDSFFQTLFENERKNPSNTFYVARLVTINHGLPNPYPFINSQEGFYISPRGVSYNAYNESLFSSSLHSSIRYIFSNKFTHTDKQVLPSHKEVMSALSEVEQFYKEELVPTLNSFTPINNLRISPSYNIYTNSIQKEIIIKGISLDFKIGNNWLPFSALSSGTQRLFYIISEITTSFLSKSGYGYHGATDKITLLEEPELGIHPDQLEKLLVFLREQSKKNQLIITTHSPQVLDMLNDDELDRITICELHKTKGTQFRKLKKTQITTAQRYMREQGLYLSDYWRYGSLESTK